MRTREGSPIVFLIRFLSIQDPSTTGPGCTLLKPLVPGLELLGLQGQINVVSEDSSQQAAVTVFCGHGLLLPQPLPGLKYLCAESEMPVGPSAFPPT